MKRVMVLLSIAAGPLAAFSEPLPQGSTSGIWGEGFLGMNFTGGQRQDQSLSGWGINGGAGFSWWIHHNIGLRGQFRFMNYNLKSGQDAVPKLTYSYMGYGTWGALLVRFGRENSQVMPYLGAGGGYFWPTHGTVTQDLEKQKLPEDSLRSTVLYGGLLGTMFRLPHNTLWKTEMSYDRMGDDFLLNISTGFIFKALW